jgi:hypothetical protein
MENHSSALRDHVREKYVKHLLCLTVLGFCLLPVPVRAQSEPSGSDLGSCTLKDHVYRCDGATFQQALANVKNVTVQTHNADGVGRAKLTTFVTTKLGKTIASPDASPDLVFLLLPFDQQGNIVSNQGDRELGTLRIYSALRDGKPGHLLWAESFSGPPDMPWPMVVRGLILQLESHFHLR